MEYPIRINKYLAQQKIASRREADVLISQKKVKINEKIAKLGDIVNKNDKIEVLKFTKNYIYLAFNKPKNIITHSPQDDEQEIKNIINIPEKVVPIGRLDKDSHGLIILSNDGRITDKLLNPIYDHEKEYLVKVDKPIKSSFIRKMSNGVVLEDGYKTKKCIVEEKEDNFSFSIILTEGKKRQIRRMCAAFGYSVTDLLRVRILNIKLGNLPTGQYKKISGLELNKFLSYIDLKSEV